MVNRTRCRAGALVVLLLALAGGSSVAQSASCGAPPPAQPQRIAGGESFPPLPLPATPLRRTERKRSPSPPVLIAKLEYGEQRQAIGSDGKPYTYYDWKSDPADCARLLGFVSSNLGMAYREEVVAPPDFEGDPTRRPILYVTGHHTFSVPAEVRDRIRAFVLAGGTLWGDACCGSQAFTDSFAAFVKDLFPKRRFAPLPPDHPLFRAFFPIQEVAFQEGAQAVKKGPPEILAVEIGCRAAVLCWRYDLSCGWDGHVHDVGGRVEPSDALRLGTNLLAYTLACQELGRFLASEKTYYEDAATPGVGQFVFGQLMHQGDWDPNPSGVANLLKAVNAGSAVEAQFVRRKVNPAAAELHDIPFLYVTGHHDFGFSIDEVQALRDYLSKGGFLFADCCCGRQAFDAAFRRELERILPGRRLEPIPLEDPLFETLNTIAEVRSAVSGQTGAPRLEGVRIDGFWAVVYCKDGMGNGWEGVAHPLVDGIAPEDSLKLGANVIMYALTH